MCEEVGEDFDRDITIQLRVARPIDLAHPPCADLGEDVVDAEACAGGERQTVVDYTGGTAALQRLLLRSAAVFTVVVMRGSDLNCLWLWHVAECLKGRITIAPARSRAQA